MNITDIRRHGIPRDKSPQESITPARPSVSPRNSIAGPPLTQLTPWLEEFCQLHHISVQVLDSAGETVLGPIGEPVFCQAVCCGIGSPFDCARTAQDFASADALHVLHCRYHLSQVVWRLPATPGTEWTFVIGRTFASQDQVTRCLEAIQESESLGDNVLAALGSVPWLAEPQLLALAHFLRSSLQLIFAPNPPPARRRKNQDPSVSGRKALRG